MKNIKGILQLLIMTLVFFGCQTEEITNSKTEQKTEAIEEVATGYDFKVEVKNGMLAFATREDYDKTLDYVANLGDDNFAAWEKEISFKSMRSVFNESELEEMGIFDNLLAVFLNPEGMISFGENTFKVDYITNEVIMVTNQEFSAKSGFTGKSKRAFKADDDIFGLLDGTVSESENLSARHKRGRGCPGNRGRFKNENVYIGQDKFEIKAEYQRFWPYYSLQAKIKRADGAVVEETYIGLETLDPTFFKKRKRRTWCDDRYNNQSRGGYGRSYNLRIYYSSRQLKAYDFYVHFFGSNTQGSLDTTLRPRCRTCEYNY